MSDLDALARVTRLGSGEGACTPVVVTFNSARWIAHLHAFYRNCRISPLYVVDARSSDRTAEILAQAGAAHVALHTGETRVEGLIGQIRDHVATDWVIRFDDDECPSAELLSWLHGRSAHEGDATGFVRRWLRFTPSGGLEYAANRSWDWRWRDIRSKRGEDRQFRLWHRDRVEYVSRIHSPGFDYARGSYAPIRCVIYHLTWILRTEAERAAKVLDYEAQCRGAGSGYAKYYLPERVPGWAYRGDVAEAGVALLARRLSSAGPEGGRRPGT